MATDKPRQILVQSVLDYEKFTASLDVTKGFMTLTARERADWRQDSLWIDDIALQVIQEGGANCYEGEASADYVTLALGLHAPSWIHALGVALDEHCMVRLRPGEAVTSHCSDVSRYALLVMPVERFVESVDRIDPTQTEPLMSGGSRFEISPANRRFVVDLVERVLSVAATENALHSRESRQAVVEELIRAFVGTALSSPHGASQLGRPRKSRRRIISHVRELLNNKANSSYSVGDLARYANVSERTLRDVVKEQFGVTPKQLMTFRQLQAGRIALRDASPDASVARIESDLGVWEFGRFARQYRALFGELPSETRARSAMRSKEPAGTTPAKMYGSSWERWWREPPGFTAPKKE